jgi:hypothetical protein
VRDRFRVGSVSTSRAALVTFWSGPTTGHAIPTNRSLRSVLRPVPTDRAVVGSQLSVPRFNDRICCAHPSTRLDIAPPFERVTGSADLCDRAGQYERVSSTLRGYGDVWEAALPHDRGAGAAKSSATAARTRDRDGDLSNNMGR